MKNVTLLICMIVFLFSCKSNQGAHDIAHTINSIEKEDLFITGNWFPTTDSYGSSFTAHPDLVVDGAIEVEFEIVQKVGDEWPYIELICESGKDSLKGVQSITLEYKCDKSLAIKLSQKDFGSEGDNSYAHYYISVPPANDWTIITVNIEDFDQPNWATSDSRAIDLNLANVKDIYLVPNASYQIGEKSKLSVRSLVIQ